MGLARKRTSSAVVSSAVAEGTHKKRKQEATYKREALQLLGAEFHRFTLLDIRHTLDRCYCRHAHGSYAAAWRLLQNAEEHGLKAELLLEPLEPPRERLAEGGRYLTPRPLPRSRRLRSQVRRVARSWERVRSEFKMWADGLFFSMDRDGKEQLMDADGCQVMMEWEKPWMVQCVDELGIGPDSDVLEIGFGCGYSAERIQRFGPHTHTIIECSEPVLERLREWAKSRPSVRVVEGTWQEKLPKLGIFDCVFFDDYGTPGRADREMEEYCPRASYKQEYAEACAAEGGTHFHGFLNIVLRWHSHEATRITGYLEYPLEMQRDDVDASYRHTPVEAPPHCDYWPAELCKNAVVPLFVKKPPPIDEDVPIDTEMDVVSKPPTDSAASGNCRGGGSASTNGGVSSSGSRPPSEVGSWADDLSLGRDRSCSC